MKIQSSFPSGATPLDQINAGNLWNAAGVNSKRLPGGELQVELGNGIFRLEGPNYKGISGLKYGSLPVVCKATAFEEVWWYDINALCGSVIKDAQASIVKSSPPTGHFDFTNHGFPKIAYYQAPLGVQFKGQASFLLMPGNVQFGLFSQTRFPVDLLRNFAEAVITAPRKTQEYLYRKPVFCAEMLGGGRTSDGSAATVDGMEPEISPVVLVRKMRFSPVESLEWIIDHESGHFIADAFSRSAAGQALLGSGNRQLTTVTGGVDLSKSDFPSARAVNGGVTEVGAEINALIGKLNRLYAAKNGIGFLKLDPSIARTIPAQFGLSEWLVKKVAPILELHFR